jgi:hypothetical protein
MAIELATIASDRNVVRKMTTNFLICTGFTFAYSAVGREPS